MTTVQQVQSSSNGFSLSPCLLPVEQVTQFNHSPSNNIIKSNSTSFPTSTSTSTSLLPLHQESSHNENVNKDWIEGCLELKLLIKSGKLKLIERIKLINPCPSSSSSTFKRRKLNQLFPSCESCVGSNTTRPFVCLECGIIACGREGGNHLALHAKELYHHLWWDVKSGAIFCGKCDDYIYDPIVESILSQGASSKMTDSNLLTQFDKNEFTFQPRGLRNLGQTCFMSCVLQSFLHNPLLRAYFLSDRHHRDLCSSANDSTKSCMACEMDHLFCEFCSNDTAVPFGPTSFLHTMWQCSNELSGYAQQDSHEFLISALNLIHTATPGSTEDNCPCVVHSIFGGQLRSEVRCGQCNNVTQSVDPMLDLSLDLRSGVSGLGEINTLIGCLKRFTSPEVLPTSQYVCAACGESKKGAIKQLSIKKLPSVLNIQLKRFEHAAGAHKIESFVRFPLTLNMRDYTSSTTSKSPTAIHIDEHDSSFEYDLISVVNHEGSLSQGHYTTYCREANDFYCFDDDKVKRAPLKQVLDSKAYILVYLKKTLAYSRSSSSSTSSSLSSSSLPSSS